jgi:hypothetical protein
MLVIFESHTYMVTLSGHVPTPTLILASHILFQPKLHMGDAYDPVQLFTATARPPYVCGILKIVKNWHIVPVVVCGHTSI